jgi:hypothetical protein
VRGTVHLTPKSRRVTRKVLQCARWFAAARGRRGCAERCPHDLKATTFGWPRSGSAETICEVAERCGSGPRLPNAPEVQN